ncbi:hypothetical protein NDU88_006809 [Pleurodeles waltl]|uniref:Uncharacterized protein n=1 Tax=Pleurodeles waltl TaxID=8319 RepID=A0AAV7PJX3_PLEWA|nr:hypothetical protein NDU88_006809 [Pleurodeles waltl]
MAYGGSRNSPGLEERALDVLDLYFFKQANAPTPWVERRLKRCDLQTCVLSLRLGKKYVHTSEINKRNTDELGDNNTCVFIVPHSAT